MKRTVTLAPKGSLVLVMDRAVGVIPETMDGRLVAATPTCVAVGTLSEQDGDTSLSLSDEAAPFGFVAAPVFEGVLRTPSRVLSVCSVPDDVLLEMTVPSDQTRVRIYANDATEPDSISVVVVPDQVLDP